MKLLPAFQRLESDLKKYNNKCNYISDLERTLDCAVKLESRVEDVKSGYQTNNIREVKHDVEIIKPLVVVPPRPLHRIPEKKLEENVKSNTVPYYNPKDQQVYELHMHYYLCVDYLYCASLTCLLLRCMLYFITMYQYWENNY